MTETEQEVRIPQMDAVTSTAALWLQPTLREFGTETGFL